MNNLVIFPNDLTMAELNRQCNEALEDLGKKVAKQIMSAVLINPNADGDTLDSLVNGYVFKAHESFVESGAGERDALIACERLYRFITLECVAIGMSVSEEGGHA